MRFFSLNRLWKFSLALTILLFVGCENSGKLDGMWVTEDNDHILFFKENIFYQSEAFPTKYHILGNTIWLYDVINFWEKRNIPFELKGDSLWMKIGYSEENLLFKKSKFDNIFDHKIDQLGINLDLQEGFSDLPPSNKGRYRKITIGYKNDSLKYFLEDKELTFEKLNEELLNDTRLFVSSALTIDKNLPFSAFKKSGFYHSFPRKTIIPGNIYHSIRNKPQKFFGTKPWEQVSYEKINSLHFESEIQKEFGKEVNFIDLEVDGNSNFLINKIIVQEADLISECKNKYAPKPLKAYPINTIFRIVESKNLTYGNFLFFYSAISKVVFDEREKFAQNTYEKSYKEILLEGSKGGAKVRIRDSLPKIILIKDTP